MSQASKGQALAPTRARHKISSSSKTALWTETDDHNLIEIVQSSSVINWQEIAAHFPGKTIQQVSERWSKVLDPSLVKGSWTKEEDEEIIRFVTRFGTKNWTKLATMLPGRIGKQCRERWRNHLDPANNTGAWTPEEDQQLIALHEKFGNSWVKISACMPGRTDNAIKNRWNSALKKKPVLKEVTKPVLTISLPLRAPSRPGDWADSLSPVPIRSPTFDTTVAPWGAIDEPSVLSPTTFRAQDEIDMFATQLCGSGFLL